MSVGPAALPAAVAGRPYSQAFVMSGPSGAVSFDVTGELPQGLSLIAGVLVGTPAVAGRALFTITGTDGYDCRASRSYALDMDPGPPDVTITRPSATGCDVGQCEVSVALTSAADNDFADKTAFDHGRSLGL